MIKQMVSVFTYTQTELATKVSGKMTFSTAKAKRVGTMAQFTQESTLQAKSMAMAYIPGTTGAGTMEIGMRIR
jgi:hypothetical protein